MTPPRIVLYRSLPGLALLIALASARAQQSPVVSGLILDPSGALVPNANITFHQTKPAAPDREISTPRTGRYSFSASSPGAQFEILVTAPGFAAYDSGPMRFRSDETLTLNVHLKIQAESQQVDVTDTSALDPAHNADAITLTGKAIDNLPLDPNELLQELQGLSGGPTPDIYVDGFSNGTLPPRDTIREIRINQNPYSAQWDTNPTNGRVEILTKPGSNKLHGDLYTYGNTNALNTRDPFNPSQPSYYFLNTFGNLNGPLGKHASFFLHNGTSDSQSNALINAQTLDSGNNQIYVDQALPAPTTSYDFNARVDAAVGAKSTVVLRYVFSRTNQTNAGIGQLALASQGYNSRNTVQTLQLSNSQILSPRVVQDTRFQYTRSRVSQTPDSTDPTLNVNGAFLGGGNSGAAYNDNQDRFELQNYLSATRARQFFTFGGRFRLTRDANRSTANYNGTYTFASLALSPTCTPIASCNSYQTTQQGIAAGLTPAQILAAGGEPSQFSITVGSPGIAVTVADTALFFQDDWKARPNLTLSGGLRFETQNVISDHADFAPRFGLAWGLNPTKKKPATLVLRAGAGLFYTRFSSGYVLQAERQDGIHQQQFIATDPLCFPGCTAANAAAVSSSTIYRISPSFHAPYTFSSTLSLERQLKTWGNVSLSYLFNRGVHQQLTRNINAPLPGTYNPAVPSSGTRPLGTSQNIYEYESGGVNQSNRLSANYFLQFKSKVYLYGFYQLRHDTADVNGGGFPSNQYSLAADAGRASSDIRHSASAGIGTDLPLHFQAGAYLRAQSGNPFNIIIGQDLNGDSIFNDRPSFATDLTRPSVVRTAYGNFDTSPIPGQTIIPINYGHGPGIFLVNLNLGRNFSFGPIIKPTTAPKLAPGQKPQITRRFNLTIALDATNVFNQVNLQTPVSTLSSPLFGRSIALSNQGSLVNANRVINLESFFRF